MVSISQSQRLSLTPSGLQLALGQTILKLDMFERERSREHLFVFFWQTPGLSLGLCGVVYQLKGHIRRRVVWYVRCLRGACLEGVNIFVQRVGKRSTFFACCQEFTSRGGYNYLERRLSVLNTFRKQEVSFFQNGLLWD